MLNFSCGRERVDKSGDVSLLRGLSRVRSSRSRDNEAINSAFSFSPLDSDCCIFRSSVMMACASCNVYPLGKDDSLVSALKEKKDNKNRLKYDTNKKRFIHKFKSVIKYDKRNVL